MNNQDQYLPLKPEILNYFFENIIKQHESYQFEDSAFNSTIYFYWKKLYDLGHHKWHLKYQNNILVIWRRETWLKAEEKRLIDEESRKEFQEVLEERREAFNRIRRGICELLGIDPNDEDNLTSVNKLAEKAMSAKSQGAKDLVGKDVDLDKIRDFPEKKKHQVMTGEKGKDYVL